MVLPPKWPTFSAGCGSMKTGMRSLPDHQDLARTAGIVAVCIYNNPQPVAGGLHESTGSTEGEPTEAGSIGMGCKGGGCPSFPPTAG
jgi:hypothetical protein